MNVKHPDKRALGPLPAVKEHIRSRLSERELQGMETLFALRAASQQAQNTIGEWFAGTVGSTARYQILMTLWASKGEGISHKDIVEAMGVTRPTVSGLMTALEREGFVKSTMDKVDRRKQIARLTPKGETAIKRAFELNKGRFRAVCASLTPAELETLQALLLRVRDAFAEPR
jgi:DNA-binding MarR family transcriptional regulator